MQNAAMAEHTVADRSPAATDRDRITITLTPQGRRAVDYLTTERGADKSRQTDAALILLARIWREVGDGADGTSLAIRRADGTIELLHVT